MTTDHDDVSADHEAYILSEGADEVHQCRALVWGPGQDETLRPDKCQRSKHQKTPLNI